MKKGVQNFILMGPQGCGKGTQAKLLMKRFKNLYYVSTGDLFRKFISGKSDAAQTTRKIVDSGGLPYDDLATMLWMHEIAFNVKENQGIIADGMPRRLNEAKNFYSFLKYLNREKNTIVFLIHISERETFNRLTKRRVCKKCGQIIPWIGKYKDLKKCDKCGGELVQRLDDTIEGIKSRLKWHKQQTVPAINYFKKMGMLIKINGEQSIGKVFKDILKSLNDQSLHRKRN